MADSNTSASTPDCHVGSSPANTWGIGSKSTSAQNPYAIPIPIPPLRNAMIIVSAKN